jgi:Ca-activated chloride channel family protein
MTLRHAAAAALAAALLAWSPGLGGAGQDAFRATTDLVSVYATVTDGDGHLVSDLTREDFVVRDDGRERPLAVFSNDIQPFSLVMLLDRSGSMADHFGLARDAGLEFVNRMLPEDYARIGSFSRDVVLSPATFTNDREELARILRHELQELGPSPVWLAIDRSMTALLPLEGRRVVLVFTDGHDEPAAGQPRVRLDDLLRRTRTNGILVYAIGFSTEVVRTRVITAPRMPLQWPFPGSGRRQSRTVVRSRTERPPDPGLRRLAEESGGGYFEIEPGDNLRGVFSRVAEELHTQYWLGFTPERLDGEEHEIEVEVRRRGLDVRARRTYLARADQADP